MTEQEIMDKKIGTKDIPRLEAKEIEIQGIKVKEVGEKKAKIIVAICKHPDSDKLMEVTKIKISRNDKLKVVGLWYSLDEDENIQKGSSAHELMKLGKVDSLGELVGKKIPTIEESKESLYLVFKAY